MIENFVQDIRALLAAKNRQKNAAAENWINEAGSVTGKQPALAMESCAAIRKLSAEIFRAIAGRATSFAKRMTNAPARLGSLYRGRFSYRSTRLHGERWLLAGDAAGFIDPIFSSGVFLAGFLAASKCADVLHEVLNHPQRARKLFRRYERSVNRADGHLSAVCERMVHKRVRGSVSFAAKRTRRCAGGECGARRKRRQFFPDPVANGVFYFLVWLQKHFGIVRDEPWSPTRCDHVADVASALHRTQLPGRLPRAVLVALTSCATLQRINSATGT